MLIIYPPSLPRSNPCPLPCFGGGSGCWYGSACKGAGNRQESRPGVRLGYAPPPVRFPPAVFRGRVKRKDSSIITLGITPEKKPRPPKRERGSPALKRSRGGSRARMGRARLRVLRPHSSHGTCPLAVRRGEALEKPAPAKCIIFALPLQCFNVQIFCF